jgi:DNA/RNA-binding domain of Phe-tRNA-synthetase-like protein
VLLRMAAEDPDPRAAALAKAAAESQLVFPDEATLAELRTYRELRDDDEIAQWNDAFGEFFLEPASRSARETFHKRTSA